MVSIEHRGSCTVYTVHNIGLASPNNNKIQILKLIKWLKIN